MWREDCIFAPQFLQDITDIYMQVESQQNRELFRQLIANRDRVIVELGSGPAKKAPGSIGVDLLPLAGVAQLAEAEVLGASKCGFESHRRHRDP